MTKQYFSDFIKPFEEYVLEKDFTALNMIYSNSHNLVPFFHQFGYRSIFKEFFEESGSRVVEDVRKYILNSSTELTIPANVGAKGFYVLLKPHISNLFSCAEEAPEFTDLRKSSPDLDNFIKDLTQARDRAFLIVNQLDDIFAKIPKAETLPELVSLFRLIGGDYIFAKTRKEHILRHFSALDTDPVFSRGAVGAIIKTELSEEKLLEELDTVALRQLLTLVVDARYRSRSKIKSDFTRLDEESAQELFSHISTCCDVQLRLPGKDIMMGADDNHKKFKVVRDITFNESEMDVFVGDRIDHPMDIEEFKEAVNISVGHQNNGSRIRRDSGLFGTQYNRAKGGTDLGKNCYGLNTIFARTGVGTSEQNIKESADSLNFETDILDRLDAITGFNDSSEIIFKAEEYGTSFEQIRLLENALSCVKMYRIGLASGELKDGIISTLLEEVSVEDESEIADKVEHLQSNMIETEEYFSSFFNCSTSLAVNAIKTVIKVHRSRSGVIGRREKIERHLSNINKALHSNKKL